MKEFWIYTGMRALLFVASFAVVFGIWSLVSDTVALLPVLLIALIVSGIASYFLLNRQRDAFARKVQVRAERATQRHQERTAKEDTD